MSDLSPLSGAMRTICARSEVFRLWTHLGHLLLKGSGPIRASSTNIKCCAKQIDSKDIFILSGRLKSLSSKDNGRQSGSRINSYLIGMSTRAPVSHTQCKR